MLSAAIGVVVIGYLSWRVMFLLGGVSMLVAWWLSGRYFIESPRWLAGKGKGDVAQQVVCEIEQQVSREKNIALAEIKPVAHRSAGTEKAVSGSSFAAICCAERWWRSRYWWQ
jgi:putative MFS transporter